MITVLSLAEAKQQAQNFDLVISLLDPPLKIGFVPFAENQHVWWFNDTLWSNAKNPPTKKDMEEIMKVYAPYADKRVLIHCLAGISRSPAVAIGLKIQHGMTIQEAFEDTFRQRPRMFPNDLILQLFDQLLNLNGKLVRFDEDWKLKNNTMVW